MAGVQVLKNPIGVKLLLENILSGLVRNFLDYLRELSMCSGAGCLSVVRDAVNHIVADVELSSLLFSKFMPTSGGLGVDMYSLASAVENVAYEVRESNEVLSRSLFIIAEALYAADRGDVKASVALLFASYMYLNGMEELARELIREALGEGGLQRIDFFYEMGYFAYKLSKLGIIITNKDLE